MFSLILRLVFRNWCCYVPLLMVSPTLGFTTTTFEETNNYYRAPRLHNRPLPPAVSVLTQGRHGCQSNQPCQPGHIVTESGTALRASFSMELPIVSDIVSTYTYCLKYHYFPTQSITNAILTVVGDGIAQTQESSLHHTPIDRHIETGIDGNTIPSYDPKRGLVYFFKGLGSGVMWAWWFDMAELWSMELTQSALSYGGSNFDIDGFQQSREAIEFATSATGTDVLSAPAQSIRTAINIISEQFLVCPILFSLWDIPVTSLMRGCPAGQVPEQIKEKLVPLLVANAKVWTLVNVITYNIPLEYRLLFTSVASIISESINSGITSKVVVPGTPKQDAQQLSESPTEMGIDTSIDTKVIVPSAGTIATMIPLERSNSIGFDSNNLTIVEL